MKLPSLPLFTDTYSAETVHLSNEKVGMYIRLLCFAWTKKGKPFTTQSANTICQCKTIECEGVVLEVLDEFFIRGDNRNTWTHKRLSTEMNYLLDYYYQLRHYKWRWQHSIDYNDQSLHYQYHQLFACIELDHLLQCYNFL